MKRSSLLFLVALSLAGAAHAAEVTVAVAANFLAPMQKIAAAFEQETGQHAALVSGSTGSFYHQISRGAPFDVLLAADDTTPAKLEKEGFAVAGSRFTYAVGKLALWSAQPGFVDGQGEVLKSGRFDRIALANPELAPYGAAAIETLKNLGVLAQLEPKFVRGENIAQTYQFVATRNAPLGFVALSEVFSAGRIAQGSGWIVPERLHAPIRQDAVVLSRARSNPAAQALVNYLRGPKAREIIASYGYQENAIATATAGAAAAVSETGWPAYGGTAEGRRWSDAAAITPENVDGLRQQWSYRTGDAARRDRALMRRTKFETTPILVEDRLVFCTPFNEVIALDPADGRELWRFDPKVATDRRPANRYTCRGVAQWLDAQVPRPATCQTRIFEATADARLIALDAGSGAPCSGFGRGGEVKIDPGALVWPGEFQITSAPVVAGDVVIVGSAINDNGRVAAPSGAVRAFDARSGRPMWTWDPLDVPGKSGVAQPRAGNVWAPMSVDEKRGLVFLPTSSPSPDFFGGARPGDNRNSDSVVALHVASGAIAWSFQIVHHDLWDYDVPAQPTLATIQVAGAPRDVVIQGTKQGFVFVLDRDSGAPVFPVEERPVPQDGAPGEVLSPTQPFPADLPPLVPAALAASQAFGITPFDRNACAKAIGALRNEGLYTPPSEQGTLLFPFTGGGVNWGGVAIDPRGIVYVNTSRMAHAVKLIARADFARFKAEHPKTEVSPQTGTPFGMERTIVMSPLGAPCNPPPWGMLAALDLNTRKIVWQSVLGTSEELYPLGLALASGTPTLGGPVATAGGLIFIGATMDRYLRAFNATTGAELWRGRLPVPALATPMTYTWHGRQFVVIAAGGHGEAGTAMGDSIVAFALPAAGEATRSLWDRTIDQPGGRFAVRMFAIVLAAAALIAVALKLRSRRRRARGLSTAGSTRAEGSSGR